MSVTPDSFIASYPAFASKLEGELDRALLDAIADCPPEVWGDHTDRGVMLKMAHLLAMDWYETAAIASAGVALAGGQSARAPGGSGDDLDLTTHGRQFKALRRQVVGNPIGYFSGY